MLLLYCPTSDSNCWYHTALIHLITTNFTYIILLNITRYNNNCRSCALTYQEEHPCRDKHDDCCCTRIKLQFRRAEINRQSFITSVWVHQIMSRYIYNRRIHSHFTWNGMCLHLAVFWRIRSANWDKRQRVKHQKHHTAEGIAVLSAAVPVHDVGGQSGWEAEHVEADLCGCAESQANHDREQGHVHPQPCRWKVHAKQRVSRPIIPTPTTQF